MRQITTALKSSKTATVLALSLAVIYGATEFGDHPVQQAGAAISPEMQSSILSDATDPQKIAGLVVPLPNLRPLGLPFIEQPYQIDVVSLTESWSGMSYDIDEIRVGQKVPRYFVEQMPVDILDIRQVQVRKKVFLSVTLPLILRANEEIIARRSRLQSIMSVQELKAELSPSDTSWVTQLTELYGSKPGNMSDLLGRVDVIPVSLVLAQSIEESGWGTSRFAREGNALFGQRVWSAGQGIVPKEREGGLQYEVKAFDALYQSIRSYIHNLNSHKAYKGLRFERVNLKRDNGYVSGYALSGTLQSYSERGADYIDALRSLIRVNKLNQFEDAKLIPEQVAQIFN
ncbi:MAG: glucosaminidase domain-containing protein [Sneathiella sp.]|nr:glucosaminidase domain-containing protein [Sneathiella sp.]